MQTEPHHRLVRSSWGFVSVLTELYEGANLTVITAHIRIHVSKIFERIFFRI